MPEFEQRNDVETTTSSIRETSPQVSGPVKELFLENQTRNTPVQCLSGSKERPLEIQQNETHMTANNVGVDNILPPKKNNFTNSKQNCEARIYEWTLYATILYTRPKTKEWQAVSLPISRLAQQ